MAYPAGFETRSDSAVGGTIDDVATTDPITASNHNILQSAIYELEKKLGLATIAKADTAGHFAMPHTTDGGPPTGNPDNGEGSMVWDSANNKLYVATADSATWAEIGGGSSAFTEAVTVTIDDGTIIPLTLTQEGAGNILKGIGADTDQFFLFKNDGSLQLNTSPEGSYNPTHDFGAGSHSGFIKVYGLDHDNQPVARFNLNLSYGTHAFIRLTGRSSAGASLFIGDDAAGSDYEYELGIRSGSTDLFFKGADAIWTTSHAAGGAFVLTRPIRYYGIAGITASTSQSQGNGALTADINEISTVGSTNDTCTMPTAVAWMRVTVINNGAETMQLYPASGDNLGAGVDTVTTLAAGANITYQAYDSTNWEAV